MRIALFTPLPVSRSIGATKNRVEFADALQSIGWQTQVIGSEGVGASSPVDQLGYERYQRKLKDYLNAHSDDFDVALVEADTLPFPRSDLPADVLIVARPAMVWSHHQLIRFPEPRFGLTRRCVQYVKARVSPHRCWTPQARRAHQIQTCQNADLIHALTQWDADALRADGVRSTPVAVIPNGIDSRRALELREARMKTTAPSEKSVVFVGSFDFRKGCLDLIETMGRVWQEESDCRLTLLGAKGLFQRESDVRRQFGDRYQDRIDVVMEYDNAVLPELLAQSRIGLFPSYIEGFPFGCLELIASGIPTVAYRSPGAESFVPESLLVSPGDTECAAKKIVQLMRCEESYRTQSSDCINAASRFDWKTVAASANDLYKAAMEERRGRVRECA